jgi:hypothetical protein
MKVVYLIFWVVFFNFIAYNSSFGLETYFLFRDTDHNRNLFCGNYITVLSLNKIQHHIKFVPIVLIILIYEISKIFHLPALIFSS